MIQVRDLSYAKPSLLLATGLLLGLALAIAMASISWQAGAVGLGFALAVLAGIVQRCST